MKILLTLSILALLLTSCSTAYYAAMDKLGYEKRHILVDRVKNAKESQIDAKEQFASALDEFIAVTNYQGGELEKVYRRIDSSYKKSVDRANDVKGRNDAVERTGKALFKEWNREIKQFTDPELAAASRQQYVAAEERYEELLVAMRSAEAKLDPVLKTFNDQTLFLKHNLNAKAINALESQVTQVKIDVNRLIRDMERSIAEADRFISQMR
ncbi:MAG: DUF2959 domain-containing protein [Verrucomicrobiota bacterium JB023]|nr:DUF2959 domain-containing protein [Verrucomicrobiota bacterium JB023]